MRARTLLSAAFFTGILVAPASILGTGCNTRRPTEEEAPAALSELGPGMSGKGALAVTPVSGPSVISRLGLRLEQTTLGQVGGAAPPPDTERREPTLPAGAWTPRGPLATLIHKFLSFFRDDQPAAGAVLDEPFVLTGADLYRLNCQSCHGADGSGAPPEIYAYIGPVQGASPSLIRQRIEERGRVADEDLVQELAAEGEQSLRDRLLKGGKEMPGFPHLEGAEVEALIHYSKRQSRVPEATGPDEEVTQSVVRVGEHVVKGTCHVCHDATGPGGGHMMMMRGVVASLASFVDEKSPDDLIHKVRRGASGMMGMMGTDRMPVYPYLTEEEIVAAYLYLVTYPPRP